ncbi:unnamed protein product, partial [Polarella glacialis]
VNMVPMVGLAYWPLLLWVPLLAAQCLTAVYLGSGMQGALRSITGLLVDTPVAGFLKIVWVVLLVLCLDCLRGVFTGARAPSDGLPNAQMFETYAAKEGALVMALNLVAMMAVQAMHVVTGKCIKLELHMDILKRQAQQQGQFAKQLLEADEKKATSGVPLESKMPEAKANGAEGADESEMRKRD